MYRLTLETLLGVELKVDRLRIAPCLPDGWDGYTLHYRFRETVYHIVVRRAGAGQAGVIVDGKAGEGDTISLVDDRQAHDVEVALG
jgi:cellobiose phosphorylase